MFIVYSCKEHHKCIALRACYKEVEIESTQAIPMCAYIYVFGVESYILVCLKLIVQEC